MAKHLSGSPSAPRPIAFLKDPAAARSLLDPLRRDILEHLSEPGSASTVADALGLPRQRVNYHVRAMEGEGLLVHVEDRRRGNCVERVVRAAAERYLADPFLLSGLGLEERAVPARLSFHLEDVAASACRSLREIGELLGSGPHGEGVPAMAIEASIHFRSATEEAEFAREIREALQELERRYDAPDAGEGRTFRITVGGHLSPVASNRTSE